MKTIVAILAASMIIFATALPANAVYEGERASPEVALEEGNTCPSDSREDCCFYVYIYVNTKEESINSSISDNFPAKPDGTVCAVSEEDSLRRGEKVPSELECVSVYTSDRDEADSENSQRCYLYEEISEARTHEFEVGDGAAKVVDGATSERENRIAGFDIGKNEGISSRKLVTSSRGVIIEDHEDLTLTQGYDLEPFSFSDWGWYQTANDRFYGYHESDDENSLFEMSSGDKDIMRGCYVRLNDREEITFSSKDPLELEDDYSLTIDIIDESIKLKHGSVEKDTYKIELSKEESIDDSTFTYITDLGSAKDIIVIAVHFKDYSEDKVIVDGIWQISENPPK